MKAPTVLWLSASVVLGGLIWANVRVTPQVSEQRLAGYTTSLKGRKKAQIRNATLAARALNGQVIAVRKTFSYNAVVSVSDKDSDTGYVPAPVSVEGTMVPALGGGVCQTSTTLYNAALLAGLSVVERHPHTIAPKYVPPGRDAAVAWPGRYCTESSNFDVFPSSCFSSRRRSGSAKGALNKLCTNASSSVSLRVSPVIG